MDTLILSTENRGVKSGLCPKRVLGRRSKGQQEQGGDRQSAPHETPSRVTLRQEAEKVLQTLSAPSRWRSLIAHGQSRTHACPPSDAREANQQCIFGQTAREWERQTDKKKISAELAATTSSSDSARRGFEQCKNNSLPQEWLK